MVEESKSNQIEGDEKSLESLSEFLESIPPGQIRLVQNISKYDAAYDMHYLLTADLFLHCSNEACNGQRFFECEEDTQELSTTSIQNIFLTYLCRNCRHSFKTYALRFFRTPIMKQWTIVKYGEQPDFGPPTPAKVISLIGPDREMFLKGRQSENKGLGIGAFAYYRRVVENQKNNILDEIIRVCNRIKTQPDIIEKLESAKKEKQFSKAVESVKDAIPQVLLIDGHNPLILLHSALSEGLHAQSDDECLEFATSIRIVLTELAERLGQALKDEVELKTAISRLLTRGKTKK